MATKKKRVRVEPFPAEVLESARKFRHIRLARLPENLKSEKAAQIRKAVKAYVRERSGGA